MKRTKVKGIEVAVYEQALVEDEFYGTRVICDIDGVLANRLTFDTEDLRGNIFAHTSSGPISI